MPIEEPVLTPMEAESIPGVQVPTLPIEEELGQEEGDFQSRDIHMIIPPMFEPISPFFSPLHTESLEPMSSLSGSVFAALSEEHFLYDTATSALLLPPSISVYPLSLPLPSLPPSPVLPPPPPVDLKELLVPASLLSAACRDNDIDVGRIGDLRRLVDDLIGRVARPQGGESSLSFVVIPSLVRVEADAYVQLLMLYLTSEGMVPVETVAPIITTLMRHVKDVVRPREP